MVRIFFKTVFSISYSLKTVFKCVLMYETVIAAVNLGFVDNKATAISAKDFKHGVPPTKYL